MKNYKVQVNLVRKDNPDELVESFTIEMTYSIMEQHQSLGTLLGKVLDDNDIDADDLEHYKVEVELVEE